MHKNSPSKKLDKRLAAAAALLPEDLCIVADIGTDHAWLPIRLLLDGRAAGAILSDLREGPLMRAKENAAVAGIFEKCSFRLGNGLSVLKEGEADGIVLAGMGGETIAAIAQEGRNVLLRCKTAVFQPQSAEDVVRRILPKIGLKTIKNIVVREGRRYYHLFAATPGKEPPKEEEEFYFPADPAIRKETDYLNYLLLQRKIAENILSSLKAARLARDEERQKILVKLGWIDKLIAMYQ